MKKIIFLLLMALICKVTLAQNWNPRVGAPNIFPAPIVNAGGTADFSFVIGNSGNDPLNNLAQPLVVVISLSKGVPNHADPIAALTGTFKSKFSWIYISASKTYMGTQVQTINGSAAGGNTGDIYIKYKIITSTVSPGTNGFNVNLTPPAYTVNSNSQNDDAASIYTYGTAGTLPVSLASFNAVVNNCVTTLNWRSGTELNFKNYEVQYSKNGLIFETIAVVNGQGDNVSYSKVHNPAQGKAYYRLNSVDNDNRSAYSQIIALNISCGKGSVLVYPNPARDVLNVNITGADAKGTMATLFNVTGQSVISKNLSNGSNQLDISRLSRGIYQLRLINDSGTENIKVVID